MIDTYFTGADAWHGGFYELALELGPRSDERLLAALQAVWQVPSLQGCYLRSDVEPAQQSKVAPSLEALDSVYHLRGVATLPNGKQVACGTCAIREEDGSDWLDFYLPLGSLGSAYDVGAFPFDDGRSSPVWREQIEDWLAGIARIVFARVPFALGLIGFEASGEFSAEQVAQSGVPGERWMAYLVPRDGHLDHHPTNIWSAPITLHGPKQDKL